MREAIRLAVENAVSSRGGPFGSVIAKNGQIIGRGSNEVTSANDPTAHAEVVAIRQACQTLGTFELNGCELYTSCQPCPMCLAAIYWARIDRYYFGCTAADAAAIQFDDSFILNELISPPSSRAIPAVPLLRDEALVAFVTWRANPNRIPY